MKVKYIIPVGPDDYMLRYRTADEIIGRAEINIYDEAVQFGNPEEFEGKTRDDFVGGLYAVRQDGWVSFNSYGDLDPSNWEYSYRRLQDTFTAELIARGLATEDEMEHLS